MSTNLIVTSLIVSAKMRAVEERMRRLVNDPQLSDTIRQRAAEAMCEAANAAAKAEKNLA
jgi:hypothetical protein